MTDLDVIIPAWDEHENLRLLLPAVAQTLRRAGLSFQILVVTRGQRDGLEKIAADHGARIVPQEEGGYGAAIRSGLAASSARYLATMDADFSHPPDFLLDFWKHRHDAEVLIASRYVPGGSSGDGAVRRLLSRALNRVYRRVLSVPAHDLSSGFRLYRRDVLAKLQPTARDFDILEEILVGVHAEGWRIHELPFRHRARRSGRSHVRLLRFAWSWLRTLLRMWRLRNSIAAADYDFRAFDSPIWLQRYWQRTRHRIVLGFLGAHERVLDVGCGSSRIIIDLPRAIGLDLALRKLRWLRPRHEQLVCATGAELPFSDEVFDAVICSEVIEHLAEPTPLIREIDRVLRPGGILILGTPDYGRWSWRVFEALYGFVHPGAYAHEHISRFTHPMLAAQLEDLGYQVLDCRYVGFSEMIFKAHKRMSTSTEPAGGSRYDASEPRGVARIRSEH